MTFRVRSGSFRLRKLTPERVVKSHIRALCNSLGWIYCPYIQGVGSTPGAPDCYVGIPGHWIAVEVKSATGRLSAAQEFFKVRSDLIGATYVVARSARDVHEVARRLAPTKVPDVTWPRR